MGLAAYEAELDSIIEILRHLLAQYDDGRRKRFYCVAVILLELPDLNGVVAQLSGETGAADSVKERTAAAVRLLEAAAARREISLKLRKKQP